MNFLDKIKFKKKVVIYLDVSKSMSEYYELYYPFLKFIQNKLKKNIDVFLFLQMWKLQEIIALILIILLVLILQKHLKIKEKTYSKRTSMIIISDGFDASEKDNLDYELKIFKSKFKKIFGLTL